MGDFNKNYDFRSGPAATSNSGISDSSDEIEAKYREQNKERKYSIAEMQERMDSQE